jgi:hypothetical protein
MPNELCGDQRRLSKRRPFYRRPVIIASSFLVLLTFAAIALLMPHAPVCKKPVDTESDVRRALAAFFNSGTDQARDFIAELRQDGMVEEYLVRVQSGCETCVVLRGRPPAENPNSWYVPLLMAPPERKRAIILEVQCADLIRLDATLYGG